MKKIKKSLSLILVMVMAITFLTTNVYAGEFNYKQIITPQYEDAYSFNEGLAAVKKDGKWGYINLKGEVVIPFQYDYAYPFSEGKAVVGTLYENKDICMKFLKMGFIDVNGNYTQFVNSNYYNDPENLEPAIEYEEAYDESTMRKRLRVFYNGVVMLSESAAYDATGEAFHSNWYVNPMFVPTEGTIAMDIKVSGKVGFTDLNGKLLFPNMNFYAINPFNQGIAPVKMYENGKISDWKFMDRNGNFNIKGSYTDFYINGVNTYRKIFNDAGLACVANKDGLWGAINKSGNTVIPFKYNMLKNYSEGVAAFKKGGKFGFIDIYGNEVIKAQFDDVTSFNDGVAVARIGDAAFCIDKKGDKIKGADKLPIESYFVESDVINSDGSKSYRVYAPERYVPFVENGKYGFGEINFIPSLPTKDEMDSWAYDEVVKAIESNLVPANLQNMYKTNTTRVDFAALVVRAIEEVTNSEIQDVVKRETGKTLYELVSKYPFKDTTDYNVIAANALGIINGVGGGNYAPEKTITRQDAAALLMRTAKFLGEKPVENKTVFSDDSNIANYAKDAVSFVSSLKIMNGTGNNNFSPKSFYTREQAYITIYRLFQNITASK